MKNLGSGLSIILNSISIFKRWPQLIVPLLLTWLIYAPTVVYLKYFHIWEQYSTPQNFLVGFGVVTLLSVTLCFSCSWLLEMLQDLEERKTTSLFDTFGRVLLVATGSRTLFFSIVES